MFSGETDSPERSRIGSKLVGHTNFVGTKPCFLSSFRISFLAALASRRRCTRKSSTSPSLSTASQRNDELPRAPQAARYHHLPPRFMESDMVSIFYTAWRLSVDPTTKFICISYVDDLAHTLTAKTRKLMLSSLHRLVPRNLSGDGSGQKINRSSHHHQRWVSVFSWPNRAFRLPSQRLTPGIL
jgi:hypothetical protein